MTEEAGRKGTKRHSPIPVGELSYKAASEELDGILEELDQGLVDVDLLVERMERAAQILDELDRRIARTRAKVEELAPHLERAVEPEAGLGRPDELFGRSDRDERLWEPISDGEDLDEDGEDLQGEEGDEEDWDG